MPEITTRDELKTYLMNSADIEGVMPEYAVEFNSLIQCKEPADDVLDTLFQLIKEEGANPYHLKLAYFCGMHQLAEAALPEVKEMSKELSSILNRLGRPNDKPYC